MTMYTCVTRDAMLGIDRKTSSCKPQHQKALVCLPHAHSAALTYTCSFRMDAYAVNASAECHASPAAPMLSTCSE